MCVYVHKRKTVWTLSANNLHIDEYFKLFTFVSFMLFNGCWFDNGIAFFLHSGIRATRRLNNCWNRLRAQYNSMWFNDSVLSSTSPCWIKLLYEDTCANTIATASANVRPAHVRCTRTYIHTCIYIYIYVCTYIHTYMQSHITTAQQKNDMHICVCVCIYIYIYVCVCMCCQAHTYTHAWRQARIYVCFVWMYDAHDISLIHNVSWYGSSLHTCMHVCTFYVVRARMGRVIIPTHIYIYIYIYIDAVCTYTCTCVRSCNIHVHLFIYIYI